MAIKIHTGQSSDTLINLSRRYFGVPNKTQDIINTNQILKHRLRAGITDSTGQPRISSGDKLVLVIPESASSVGGVTVSDDSTLTMYLNGKEKEIPTNNTEIEINFDACCNRFSAVFPWDHRNADDRIMWSPDSLPEVEIYQGSNVIFGGKFESALPPEDALSTELTTSARTHTYLIEKSCIPLSAYPLEREGESLSQTVEWACGIFGLGYENLAPPTKRQKKTSCQKGDKVWAYLSAISDNAGRILRSSLDGKKIEIATVVNSPPVAKFTEGEDGFQLSPPAFNTSSLFGNHIGQRESARGARQAVNVKNVLFDEQSYTYNQVDNTDAADLNAATVYQMYKSYRDFFTMELTIPEIVNPKTGKRFDRGDIVTINAPSRMIYVDFEMMINQIRYIFSGGGDGSDTQVRTVLKLIPPEVYQGKPLSTIPWVF